MNPRLELAWDKLWEPLQDWIHRPSAGKRALLDAYESLTAAEKEALARDVLRAMRAAHGAEDVVAWRRWKGQPKKLGLASLTTNRREVSYLDPSQYEEFVVPASVIMLHWAQEGSPLGGRSFAHEQEIILLPDAELER